MSAPIQRRASSFFLPMLLMPRKKRQAMQALYYFCRAADDAVDDASTPEQAEKQLLYWKQQIDGLYGASATDLDPVSLKLKDAIENFSLPRHYFDDLLTGLEIDCQPQVTMKDDEALKEYCYRVAGCVGLEAMHIFGHTTDTGHAFAIALGQALQITNILRDVQEDARNRRCYIPQNWLEEFGVNPAHPFPALEKETPPLIKRRLVKKAKATFDQAGRLAQRLPSRDILPALLMRDVYYRKLLRMADEQQTPSKWREVLPTLLHACGYYFQIIPNNGKAPR